MIQPSLNRSARLAARVSLGLVSGWLALASAVPHAQDRSVTGPPQPLGPAGNPAPPRSQAQTKSPRALTPRPGLKDGGIEIGMLSSTEEATIGLLGPGTGGFPADMWAGSHGPLIEKLLARLPVGTPSRVVDDLGRRLLLSAAALPEGVISGGSLLDVRLERLLAAGLADELGQLSAQATDAAKQGALAEIRTQGLLLQGQTSEACQQASDMVIGRDQPFWQKLRAFCFALAGETAAADLTADLMREKKIEDPLFFAALTRLTTGAKLELPEPARLSPLHVALLDALGADPSDTALASSTAGVLAAIAGRESFSEDVRLAAAVQAVRRGSLPVSQLGLLYDHTAFEDKERSDALALAATMAPARANALLYQVVKTHTVPSARAEALAAALKLARQQGLYPALARLYWPVFGQVVPSAAYSAVALDMVRMALVNGADDAAYAWDELLRLSNAARSSDLRDARILLAAAAPSERLDWRATEPLDWLDGAATDEVEFAEVLRAAALLEGLGYPVTSSFQTRALDGPLSLTARLPSPALAVRLKAAASARRLGEAVTLALLAVGPQGPADMAPAALQEVTSVLSRFGLEKESRTLVFEALLAIQTATR